MDIILSSDGIFNRERLIGPISWPHFDLLFIHEGNVELKVARDCGEKMITLAGGQGVLIYPDTRFSGYSTISRSEGSAHHFKLQEHKYSDTSLEHLNTLIHKQSGYRFLESNGNQNIVSLINGLLSCKQYDEPGVAKRVESQMMALILLLFDNEKFRNTHLTSPLSPEEKIAQLLSENLSVNYMIDELAHLVNFSSSHVHRLFSKRYDYGPNSYHNKLKIKKACELLQEQGTPIKSIAAQLGFIELSSFYRVFRKHTGLTPSSYRRKYAVTAIHHDDLSSVSVEQAVKIVSHKTFISEEGVE